MLPVALFIISQNGNRPNIHQEANIDITVFPFNEILGSNKITPETHNMSKSPKAMFVK